MTNLSELFSLVKDTLHYFRQEGALFPKKEKKIEIKEAPLPKIHPLSAPKMNKVKEESKWPLYSMHTPNEENLEALFSNVFKVHPLFIPIRLLLSEETSEQRLFLENVARALTRHFAAASVELEKNFKWDAPLSLAPISILQKKIPNISPNNLKNWNFGCAKTPGLIDRKRPRISNIGSFTIDQAREFSRQPKSNSSGCLGIKPHHFYTVAKKTFFVLEELDLYLNNRELKLTLWNRLKTFPFHTLFQNMPPSS